MKAAAVPKKKVLRTMNTAPCMEQNSTAKTQSLIDTDYARTGTLPNF
jgi:hypothetical protein